MRKSIFISPSKVIVDEFVNKEGKVIDIKRDLRFIDSFKFIASSLDALSKNLKPEQLINLNRFYSDEKLNLLQRKGVYPYDL